MPSLPHRDTRTRILRENGPSLHAVFPRLSHTRLTLLAILVLVCVATLGCQRTLPATGVTSVRGHLVFIDRLYPPGEGPTTTQDFTLLESFPETLWATGARVTVLDKDGATPAPGLVSGLTVGFQNAERHRELNSISGLVSPSVFHLARGLDSVQLPEGYGIPLKSNELLHASSVWQNRDLYRQPLEARTVVELSYRRASGDGKAPVKPISVFPVFTTVPARPVPKDGKASKTSIPSPLEPYDLKALQPDAEGRPAGGRWWIPPGPSEARSLVSYVLPRETTLNVRLVTAFLYDDWSRIELFDLTLSRSLVLFEPKDGALSRDYPQGLAIDTHHRLELRVSYKNPASVRHIGAGMLVLYVDEPSPPESPL